MSNYKDDKEFMDWLKATSTAQVPHVIEEYYTYWRMPIDALVTLLMCASPMPFRARAILRKRDPDKHMDVMVARGVYIAVGGKYEV